MCRQALETGGRGEGAGGAEGGAAGGGDTARKCKEVVTDLTKGEKVCVLVGGYEECQSLCLRWDSMLAHVFVIKCCAAETKPAWRWRSGAVQVVFLDVHHTAFSAHVKLPPLN